MVLFKIATFDILWLEWSSVAQAPWFLRPFQPDQFAIVVLHFRVFPNMAGKHSMTFILCHYKLRRNLKSDIKKCWMSTPPSRAALLLSYNLQRWRKAKGLSMEKLANESGIYRTGYALIELAKVAATVDSVQKLSTALGVKVWELFREPEGELSLEQHFRLPKGKKKKSDIAVKNLGKQAKG